MTKELSEEILHFFQKQSFNIVSTIDRDGFPHSSCKGIVKIDKTGRLYLLDLYRGKTWENLRYNPHIAVTAVDEHRFKGYCLKGKAEIISEKVLDYHIAEAWEKRVAKRIAQRVLKNIRGLKGHPRHPEADLPKPKYLIVMEVEKIVDLTPH
jgi:predicted pyridoxine 5'-phosphate oxidase superfamily flavin-nucleotide-binding protein